MTANRLPEIARKAERLTVDIETAVRGFARYHKYTIGTDLRTAAMLVIKICNRVWRDRGRQQYWVSELIWAVDELKLALQLASRLLTKLYKQSYAYLAPAKSGVRIGVLNVTGGHTAHRAVFLCPLHGLLSMSGPCGASSDAPVPVPGTPIRTVPLTLIGVRFSGVSNSVLEHATMQNTATDLSKNPHCDTQWPYTKKPESISSHAIARLTEAGYGASVIAGLLLADFDLATDPDQEKPTFTDNVLSGLHRALSVCLREIQEAADFLSNADQGVKK